MVEIGDNVQPQIALPNHGESRTVDLMIALPVSDIVLSGSAAALIMNHQRGTVLCDTARGIRQFKTGRRRKVRSQYRQTGQSQERKRKNTPHVSADGE